MLGFGAGVFITRILGAEGRGVYTIFYNDIQFLCLFLSFGLNTGIIYFLSSGRSTAGKLAGVSLWILASSTVALGLLLFGWGRLFGGQFIYPDGYLSVWYTVYLVGSFFLSLLNVLIAALFQGRSNFRVINFVTVYNSIINFTFFLVLYGIHHFAPGYIGVREVLLLTGIVLLLNSALWLRLYIVYIREWPVLRFSFRDEMAAIISFAGLIHLSNIINFFNYRLDVWIVEHYKKTEQLGIYSLSANIAQMFWMLSAPIAGVLLPHLSGKDTNESRATYSFYSRLNFTLVLLFGVTAFFFAGIIPLIYGKEFGASILPFRILLAGIFLSCLTKLLATVVISKSRNWYNVVASSAGFVVTLVLDLALIPGYGIIGASIATVCSYAVIFLLYFYFIYSRLDMPLGNHFIMTRSDIKYLTGMVRKKPVAAPYEYNMFADKGEAFYYRVYRHYMKDLLKPNARVLDIGCQHGRFTVPLANEGCWVTATDIDDHYFDPIKSRLKDKEMVLLFKENIHETIVRCKDQRFDTILCLEVLYTLPDFPELLKGLKGMLAEGGTLFTSHRSIGYYENRFKAEGNTEELESIRKGAHPHFNAQTAAALNDIYTKAGLKVLKQNGIGMLSGIGKDPFSKQADPGKMNEQEQEALFIKETNADNQCSYIGKARYILMAAGKL